VIVHNTQAGVTAALIDSLHKIVSPQTYPCSLCAVTYGALTIQPRWRAYLKTSQIPVAFYHRADFEAAYPRADLRLPLIAHECNDRLDVLLSATERAQLPDLDALIAAFDARLTQPPPAPPAHSARA